jgi:NADH dehydrogenase [ubiquinone] 1 alpha subcomplex assembly factor 5
LFIKQSIGTSLQMAKLDTPPNMPPDIFDRKRRMALRKRAIGRGGASFLWQHLADDLSDRLAYISRDFVDVLIIGPMTAYAAMIVADRKVHITTASLVEEDRLPFSPESFDLIITAGTLDSVNDLPGALIQMRRCLRPDGLLLGSAFGAGSLVQ